MHDSLATANSSGQAFANGEIKLMAVTSFLDNQARIMSQLQITECRKQKLKELARHYEGQERLAEILNVTPSYISQLITGHRSIGERTARKFEKLLNKPSGWMDRSSDTDLRQEARDLLSEIGDRSDDELLRIVELLRAYAKQ